MHDDLSDTFDGDVVEPIPFSTHLAFWDENLWGSSRRRWTGDSELRKNIKIATLHELTFEVSVRI